VAVFVVLNSLGAIYDRSGTLIRGNLRPDGSRVPCTGDGVPAPRNTTLTLIVTDLKATSRQLQQAARQAHASMARAIQPFHTELDGDILFFATTNRVAHPPLLAPAALGTLAAETAWDAILAAIE
jgi:L-aminopeptidase/D-esterase-like protein